MIEELSHSSMLCLVDLDEAYVAHMQKLSISSVDDAGLLSAVASGNGCFDMLPVGFVTPLFNHPQPIPLESKNSPNKPFYALLS